MCLPRIGARSGLNSGTNSSLAAMRAYPSSLGRCKSALFALLAFVSLGTPLLHAESEYDVKAAYLFKFTKFVEWPASAYASNDAPFVIGIVGRDPFGGLDRILD